jgi:hypothetical protein
MSIKTIIAQLLELPETPNEYLATELNWTTIKAMPNLQANAKLYRENLVLEENRESLMQRSVLTDIPRLINLTKSRDSNFITLSHSGRRVTRADIVKYFEHVPLTYDVNMRPDGTDLPMTTDLVEIKRRLEAGISGKYNTVIPSEKNQPRRGHAFYLYPDGKWGFETVLYYYHPTYYTDIKHLKMDIISDLAQVYATTEHVVNFHTGFDLALLLSKYYPQVITQLIARYLEGY